MKNTIDNLSTALEVVSSSLAALESGEAELSVGVDATRVALREAIVAANAVSLLELSGIEHLSARHRATAGCTLGMVKAGIQSAAIVWRDLTSRKGEGFLSRTVGATSAVRSILEVVGVNLRELDLTVDEDSRDLERDWYCPR